jgi:hypothetical protein
MPVWPKSLLTFGASARTALTAARLRNKTGGPAAQRATFVRLQQQLATLPYWREAGLEAGAGYDAFRTRVAVRGYDQLAPAIRRMQQGEENVLWPGRCAFFAATGGTTTGQPRLIPVPAALLAHFRRALHDALFYYTARVGHAGVFSGRHLFLGGVTALAPLPEAKSREAYATELGGILALGLSPAAEKHFLEPPSAIAQMTEGLSKFEAIAARATSMDISLLAGLPNWVLQFAEALRETTARHGRAPNLQVLWPNLECLVHGGVPIAPFQRELRHVLVPNIKFHEVYPACEAFLGAQDAEPAAGLRLMADTGVFYEFLPANEFDETRLEQLGPKAVPLADVKAGQDYVPLLTTPGGLARYVLGDVIRFTSVEPPRFTYVGRTSLRLSAFGERVSERELMEALLAVCERSDWSLVNYHVAPLFGANLTGQIRGAHEWWIELRPGTRQTPIGPPIAAQVDAELQRLNPHYATRRKGGNIDAPTVRLVMPGVFEHWLRFRNSWGGQKKTPHCRSDREIADELTKITNFARD